VLFEGLREGELVRASVEALRGRNLLVLTDVVDQHAAGDNNFRNDWMPDSADYGGGRAEFVHLNYPGD
jgi:hypothetical protein